MQSLILAHLDKASPSFWFVLSTCGDKPRLRDLSSLLISHSASWHPCPTHWESSCIRYVTEDKQFKTWNLGMIFRKRSVSSKHSMIFVSAIWIELRMCKRRIRHKLQYGMLVEVGSSIDMHKAIKIMSHAIQHLRLIAVALGSVCLYSNLFFLHLRIILHLS